MTDLSKMSMKQRRELIKLWVAGDHEGLRKALERVRLEEPKPATPASLGNSGR